MSQQFYLHLMHFDVVYVTHSVNANNTKGNDSLGIEIQYHTLYISDLGVPIIKLYLYGGFCVKMVC